MHELIFKNRGKNWLLLAWLLDLNGNYIKTLLQSAYSNPILKNLIGVIITLKYLVQVLQPCFSILFYVLNVDLFCFFFLLFSPLKRSQNGEVTANEANAVLMTEYEITQSGTCIKVELQKVPNIHFIRIAHLYVKMFILISHCMDICGFRNITVDVYSFLILNLITQFNFYFRI